MQSKDANNCVICLDTCQDRTVLRTCLHAFCFHCILQWSDVSHSCPLCMQTFDSCFHEIRDDERYTLYAFSPHTSRKGTPSQSTTAQHGIMRQRREQPQRTRSRFRNDRQQSEALEERSVSRQQEQALEHRRYIYRHRLFAKHMGANRISGFQQITPETFRVFPHLLDRLIPWIRRDLCAIMPIPHTQERDPQHGQNQHLEQDSRLYKYEEIGTGMEMIREYILAVLKKYDLQTEQGQGLLQFFLQEHTEHFVHEMMAFARSSLSIAAYDKIAQYGTSSSAPTLVENGRCRSDPSVTTEASSARVQRRCDRDGADNSFMRLGDTATDGASKSSGSSTVPTTGSCFSRHTVNARDAQDTAHRSVVGVHGRSSQRRASSSPGEPRSDKRHKIDPRARLPVSSTRAFNAQESSQLAGTTVTLERVGSTQLLDMSAILQAKLKRERALYESSRRRD